MAEPAFTDEAWVDVPPPEGMPEVPPNQDDLPCDDGETMETQRHKWQMDILIDAMDLWLRQRGEGYTNGNMFVYFSLEQTRGKHFRGPDVFGVPRGERKSWVVWEQGKAPDVVIELLSRSTVAVDKGEKGTWLRWAMPDGTLLPTDAERERVERAEQTLERLKARLHGRV